MTTPAFMTTPQGRMIAYHRIEGAKPGIVFLGGFRSDMEGTKAIHLQAWARAHGRAFVRFDYSGHGQSDDEFVDGCIGDWVEDACAVVSAQTDGPQVLVGSSMGGWIALLIARAMPERVAAIAGIAAAPDFTEDSMWTGLPEPRRAELLHAGRIDLPSEYSDTPLVITRRLIEDGRSHLVLRTPLDLPFPVRLLQGTADADVPLAVALRLLEHAQGGDIRLTLVKDADHRFSTPDCLRLIAQTIAEIIERLE